MLGGLPKEGREVEGGEIYIVTSNVLDGSGTVPQSGN